VTDSAEKCPLCKGSIYYPTDQYGRVMAWCYDCRLSPDALYLDAAPLFRSPTTEATIPLLLAHMEAHPKRYWQAYTLQDLLGVSTTVIRKSLKTLVDDGRLAVSRRAGSLTKYYTLV